MVNVSKVPNETILVALVATYILRILVFCACIVIFTRIVSEIIPVGPSPAPCFLREIQFWRLGRGHTAPYKICGTRWCLWCSYFILPWEQWKYSRDQSKQYGMHITLHLEITQTQTKQAAMSPRMCHVMFVLDFDLYLWSHLFRTVTEHDGPLRICFSMQNSCFVCVCVCVCVTSLWKPSFSWSTALFSCPSWTPLVINAWWPCFSNVRLT